MSFIDEVRQIHSSQDSEEIKREIEFIKNRIRIEAKYYMYYTFTVMATRQYIVSGISDYFLGEGFPVHTRRGNDTMGRPVIEVTISW